MKLTAKQMEVLHIMSQGGLLITARNQSRMMDKLALAGLCRSTGCVNNQVFGYEITPAGRKLLEDSNA